MHLCNWFATNSGSRALRLSDVVSYMYATWHISVTVMHFCLLLAHTEAHTRARPAHRRDKYQFWFQSGPYLSRVTNTCSQLIRAHQNTDRKTNSPQEPNTLYHLHGLTQTPQRPTKIQTLTSPLINIERTKDVSPSWNFCSFFFAHCSLHLCSISFTFNFTWFSFTQPHFHQQDKTNKRKRKETHQNSKHVQTPTKKKRKKRKEKTSRT